MSQVDKYIGKELQGKLAHIQMLETFLVKTQPHLDAILEAALECNFPNPEKHLYAAFMNTEDGLRFGVNHTGLYDEHLANLARLKIEEPEGNWD